MFGKLVVMFGNLNSVEIKEVLVHQVLGRIGCHSGDLTYIVPISYAYDGEYIYGHTYEGLKLDIMRQNRQVCFEVEQMENMANWKTVIAWGEFEEIKDETERNKGFQKLLDRKTPFITSKTLQLSAAWPFYNIEHLDIEGIVFRIRLTKMTGRFERNEGASSYEK